MVRHISIFIFRECPAKAENIQTVAAFLKTIPQICPAVQNQVVAIQASDRPVSPSEGSVVFGDLVQICDFETPDASQSYPRSEAHAALETLAAPLLQKVVVMDYQLDCNS